ncbi:MULTISPECIES: hypothetical protein [unclassified Streptomyces]|nr:hypothetical protein [Streptomyces sp. NBC_00425]KRD18804.1 hypothetical protein ASE41_18575 [Streptomyces sp. Root264]
MSAALLRPSSSRRDSWSDAEAAENTDPQDGGAPHGHTDHVARRGSQTIEGETMSAQHLSEDLFIEEYNPAGPWAAPTDSFVCWAESAVPATADHSGV